MANFSYLWAHDKAVELASADARNLQFCLQAPAATRHFVALLLRGWEKQGEDSASFKRLAEIIHAKPRPAVVAEYWGFNPSNGLTKMLDRLGPGTLSRAGYDHLAAILSDKRRRSLAIQRSHLSPADLRTLATTDVTMMESAGLVALKTIGRESLDLAVHAVRMRRPDLSRDAILQNLSGCKSQDDLEINALRLIENVEIDVPWDGVDDIRPVRTVADARRWADEFRNCIGSPFKSWEMLAGRSVFYISIDGPIVIQLHWDPITRIWHLDEIRGLSNRRPPARSLARVRRTFKEAGFHPVPKIRPNWLMYEW